MRCRVDRKVCFFSNGVSIGVKNALRYSIIFNTHQCSVHEWRKKTAMACHWITLVIDILSTFEYACINSFWVWSMRHPFKIIVFHSLAVCYFFFVPCTFVILAAFFLIVSTQKNGFFHCFSIQLWHFNDIQTIRCDASTFLFFAFHSRKKNLFCSDLHSSSVDFSFPLNLICIVNWFSFSSLVYECQSGDEEKRKINRDFWNIATILWCIHLNLIAHRDHFCCFHFILTFHSFCF